MNGIAPPELIMGTAQLTARYGVAERRPSAPTTSEALQLLSFAASRGVTCFDTAAAYGASEQVLGQFAESRKHGAALQVITKLRAPQTLAEWRNALQESLERLHVRRLRGLLLHSSPQSRELEIAMHQVVREELRDRVGRYGVSVYTPGEAFRAIDSGLYDLLQIPANLLDQRFRRTGALQRAREAGVAIDVRSVFLQGLLTLDAGEIPGHLQPLAPFLAVAGGLAQSCGRSLPGLALAYARDALGSAGIVVGMTSETEVEQNVAWWKSETLPLEIIERIHELDTTSVEKLLDPRHWTREN
ncbi:MAG TPA: aldo/keto reductase [Thermoanaerobaculia bacterium]|nr:aldo/keto reductase [Thermoanaerobaculia bacterium]